MAFLVVSQCRFVGNSLMEKTTLYGTKSGVHAVLNNTHNDTGAGPNNEALIQVEKENETFPTVVEVHFRSYGNDRFRKSKERILNEAIQSNWFKTSEVWSPEDLPDDFREKYSKILSMERGGGYWIWKFAIIESAFEIMKEEDILVYLDSGSRLNGNATNRFNQFIEDLKKSPYGVQGFRMWFPEYKWTTERVFQVLGVEKNNTEIRDSGQYWGGMVMLQKNDHSREFLRRIWAALETDPYIITDNYNQEAKQLDSRFKENRHDQSLSSIVRKQIGCVEYPYRGSDQPSEPFWASRLKE